MKHREDLTEAVSQIRPPSMGQLPGSSSVDAAGNRFLGGERERGVWR